MGLTAGIIKLCLEECDKSKYKFHIGAVIFKGKRILSSGHNGLRSSRIDNRYKNYINSLHAEQAALMQLDWTKLKDCSILIIKCSKVEKRLSNAFPCSMCQKFLEFVGIRDIYYSNEDGEIDYCKLYTNKGVNYEYQCIE